MMLIFRMGEELAGKIILLMENQRGILPAKNTHYLLSPCTYGVLFVICGVRSSISCNEL